MTLDRYCIRCKCQRQVEITTLVGRVAAFRCERGHEWQGRLLRRELSDDEMVAKLLDNEPEGL